MPLTSIFILLGGLATVADANTFLGRLPTNNGTATLSAESEHALLAELDLALGSGHRHATERRLKQLEQKLRPMFVAMTKNENGKLGSAAVGYVLHRVFVQRHGWFIKALEPAGNSFAAWNTSAPTAILAERVPQHVQSLFENRLGENGLGLRELAILAASLEHLVHTESLQRLNVSYTAKSFAPEDALSQDEAMELVDMYMSIYILGFMQGNLSQMTVKEYQNLPSIAREVYPTYPETLEFLKEVYQSVAPKRDYVYFSEVENVITEIGERYGKFQDIECRQFKDMLLSVEDPSVGGAGRVRISDFYGKALNEGKWQFSEGIDYLRQLGALDESDPSNLRVIIPNYLSSPSNCVASSAYYSVCCQDECEGILGGLEEMVQAPEASPATIAKLISQIPSATMPSNRTLSPWLHQRLDEVATHHGGKVPLHGRLFLQWLHYAYPRECSFPHIGGTIDPQRPENFAQGQDVTEEMLTASEATMMKVVAAAAPAKHRIPGSETEASEESGMWSMHEELVVWQDPNQSKQSMIGRFSAPIAMVGAVMSLSITLVRSLEPGLRALQKGSSKKYYV